MESTLGALTRNLAANGVNLKGYYSHATGHRVYLIVESDTLESINDALFPMLRMGTAEIEPVTDAVETIARLRERARG
jgi:hypothetical protein